jgi:hypothetical protein
MSTATLMTAPVGELLSLPVAAARAGISLDWLRRASRTDERIRGLVVMAGGRRHIPADQLDVVREAAAK